MDVFFTTFGILLAIVLSTLFILIPFFIALKRNHAYKWIILALCFFAPAGFPWVIALIWAAWPQNKSLIDPIAGNVTGTGTANAGTTTRAVVQEATAGDKLGELQKLNDLRVSGALTDAEFAEMKAKVLA